MKVRRVGSTLESKPVCVQDLHSENKVHNKYIQLTVIWVSPSVTYELILAIARTIYIDVVI